MFSDYIERDYLRIRPKFTGILKLFTVMKSYLPYKRKYLLESVFTNSHSEHFRKLQLSLWKRTF